MALNPNIPLMPRAVDVGSAFQNALLNVGRIQNMQQQAAQAQQTQQINQQALQSNALKQLVTVAPAVLQAAQSGDVAGLRSLSGNLPPQAQQELNSMIEAGDFGGIVTQAQRLADMAPQLGLGGSRSGLASAKTTIFDNGTTVQALPDGQTVVRNPEGRIVEGQERLSVLDTARKQQAAFAGQKAEETALGTARGKIATGAEVSAEAERGKSQEQREQDFINRGLAAADSTANLRRAISLLDTVETGGLDAASLRIKQLFGVEGADEGELSANLGKAVLSQLRETFGAQFTAQEGQRLEGIEAGFGRSPATNKRLLKNALSFMDRLARRGIKAAESRGDDFSIEEIRSALDFDISGEIEVPANLGQQQQARPSAPAKIGRFTVEVE